MQKIERAANPAEQAIDYRTSVQERLRAERKLRAGERHKRTLAAGRARRLVAAQRQRIADLEKQLDNAKRSQTYFDADSGIEKFDHIGRTIHHANLAGDRATRAENALAAIRARCERAEEARDKLAAMVENMASRLAVAERAVWRETVA